MVSSFAFDFFRIKGTLSLKLKNKDHKTLNPRLKEEDYETLSFKLKKENQLLILRSSILFSLVIALSNRRLLKKILKKVSKKY